MFYQILSKIANVVFIVGIKDLDSNIFETQVPDLNSLRAVSCTIVQNFKMSWRLHGHFGDQFNHNNNSVHFPYSGLQAHIFSAMGILLLQYIVD